MAKLVFDAQLCTGCRACELACSFHRYGEFIPSKSAIRVIRDDENVIDIPIGCEHCEKPLCEMVCPVKAISRDMEDNVVRLDLHICIGCGQCVTACPFGAIRFEDGERIYYKCDLCGNDPECVKWCFTGAIQFLESPDMVVNQKTKDLAKRISKSLSETRKFSR